MQKHFRVEASNSVAVVRFDRPPMNLMSFAAMSELEDVLTAISVDPSIDAVVLTGAVPGCTPWCNDGPTPLSCNSNTPDGKNETDWAHHTGLITARRIWRGAQVAEQFDARHRVWNVDATAT
jgi:1,4-dihydroxy-2-naphthoyl-CoA synthase